MPDTLTGQNAALFEILEDPANVIVAHLAKNPIAVGGSDVGMADLMEADFPGYEAITIDYWDAIDSGDDSIGQAIYEAFWEADGITEPQSVFAVYLTYQHASDAPFLWWTIVLPSPVTFEHDGDEFPFTIKLTSFDDATLPDTAVDV